MSLFSTQASETVSVALVSDTHGALHPEIEKLVHECDIAIHAGDILDGRILDRLQPRSGRVIAVTGNNDHEGIWPAGQRERVRALPRIASLQLPGGIVKIEHGHAHDWMKPSHEDLRNAHPEARLVVYGHTHRKIIDDFRKPWVVNPGAAGATRTHGGPSCLILYASEQHWRIDSYRFDDSSKAAGRCAISKI